MLGKRWQMSICPFTIVTISTTATTSPEKMVGSGHPSVSIALQLLLLSSDTAGTGEIVVPFHQGAALQNGYS